MLPIIGGCFVLVFLLGLIGTAVGAGCALMQWETGFDLMRAGGAVMIVYATMVGVTIFFDVSVGLKKKERP
jgi:hypothetical protein